MKTVFAIFHLLVCVSLTGCSILSLPAELINPERNRDQLLEGNKWHEDTRKFLQNNYLGASKDMIASEFGKPNKVLKKHYVRVYDIYKKEKNIIEADEVWIFEFSEGTPLVNEFKYAYFFYFEDDKVIQTKP